MSRNENSVIDALCTMPDATLVSVRIGSEVNVAPVISTDLTGGDMRTSLGNLRSISGSFNFDAGNGRLIPFTTDGNPKGAPSAGRFTPDAGIRRILGR